PRVAVRGGVLPTLEAHQAVAPDPANDLYVEGKRQPLGKGLEYGAFSQPSVVNAVAGHRVDRSFSPREGSFQYRGIEIVEGRESLATSNERPDEVLHSPLDLAFVTALTRPRRVD